MDYVLCAVMINYSTQTEWVHIHTKSDSCHVLVIWLITGSSFTLQLSEKQDWSLSSDWPQQTSHYVSLQYNHTSYPGNLHQEKYLSVIKQLHQITFLEFNDYVSYMAANHWTCTMFCGLDSWAMIHIVRVQWESSLKVVACVTRRVYKV